MVALKDIEEAKATEVSTLQQIKILSKQNSHSKFDVKITISRKKFESLSRNVEESDTLAEMKVATTWLR